MLNVPQEQERMSLLPTSTPDEVCAFLEKRYPTLSCVRDTILEKNINGSDLLCMKESDLFRIGILSAAVREHLISSSKESSQTTPAVLSRSFSVAIIGPSGFQGRPLNNSVYLRAREQVLKCLFEWGLNNSEIRLVARGGAFCDHIPVDLFMTGNYGGLHFHSPCGWSNSLQIFTCPNHFEVNSWALGYNETHSSFSKFTQKDSLKEIQLVMDYGATYTPMQNMHRAEEASHVVFMRWAGPDEPTIKKVEIDLESPIARAVVINLDKLTN